RRLRPQPLPFGDWKGRGRAADFRRHDDLCCFDIAVRVRRLLSITGGGKSQDPNPTPQTPRRSLPPPLSPPHPPNPTAPPAPPPSPPCPTQPASSPHLQPQRRQQPGPCLRQLHLMTSAR